MGGRENPRLAKPHPAREAFAAAEPSTRKLLDQAERAAPSASTILIEGESGTGKDLLANIIHLLSPPARAREPFVKIDCASLPHELLESELFGYERGAFTGATAMKRGRFEAAGEGTVVLDQVNALSLAMQAKMLRVLEERRFDRLGGSRAIAMGARVIAIANMELREAVARRLFREDLYFRLHVVPLHIPPLRERPADIPVITRHLLAELNSAYGKKMSLADEALAALADYSFPGNVRELRNLLERCLVQGGGERITLAQLPDAVRYAAPQANRMMSLEELEKLHIQQVLDHTRGKKQKAAEILGISRKNLLEKRKRYGI